MAYFLMFYLPCFMLGQTPPLRSLKLWENARKDVKPVERTCYPFLERSWELY